MLKGVITCSCGQLFSFETAAEKVNCPTCGLEFVAADYAEPEVVDVPPEDIQPTEGV